MHRYTDTIHKYTDCMHMPKAHAFPRDSSAVVQSWLSEVPWATGAEEEEQLDTMYVLNHDNLTCSTHREIAQVTCSSSKFPFTRCRRVLVVLAHMYPMLLYTLAAWYFP